MYPVVLIAVILLAVMAAAWSPIVAVVIAAVFVFCLAYVRAAEWGHREEAETRIR
jgi:putative flippase GtrA